MTVYVDDMMADFGRMKMCHMIADTREELDAMADRIGVQRKWIHEAGRAQEHYDICKSARTKAVSAGAVQVSWSELGRMTWARREAPSGPLVRQDRGPATEQLPDLFGADPT